MFQLRTLVLVAILAVALAFSASAFGATVAIGTVVDANGNPVANVGVYLYDENNTATSQTLAPVASATTAADGTYALDLAVTSAYESKADANGGYVNFDVEATDGTLLAFSGIARAPVPAGTCPPDIPTCRPVTGDTWADASVDLAEDDAAARLVTSSAASAPWEPKALVLNATTVPSSNASGTRTSNLGPLAPGPCGEVKTLLGTSTAWGVAGQLHLGKDQSATFTYGKSADSDIGVGYSSNNANWSIKGSVHIGNSRGSEITMSKATTTGSYGKKTKTQFQTAKFKYVNCFGQTHWGVKAQKWVAGSQWGGGTDSYNNHCNDTYWQYHTTFVPGGTFTRNDNNFANYKAALTVFNVGLSVQSGASQYVKEHWKFGNKYPAYYLCGNDGPVTDSHRIYAGA